MQRTLFLNFLYKRVFKFATYNNEILKAPKTKSGNDTPISQ
ncbi:hypothetical protein SA21338_0015 [Staphylococcus aureus subsp. aureus 21338]|nr:hypothetical protein SA21193_1052 [Staphylococcus aureus subsp. aureus 21193]EGL89867.1 hypothetical protein SA21305_1841 [Staphylococcus aureus subsp. aureus 21305]EZI08036.1 hypothetical protein SA21338_0015 [Staphylococcus aureus subsp. aureus 21338]KKI65624.1 hypothetical protein UF67_1197 [Staphylococcus aureus]